MLCVKGKTGFDRIAQQLEGGEMNGLIAPPPRPHKDSPVYDGIRLISQIISNNFYFPPGRVWLRGVHNHAPWLKQCVSPDRPRSSRRRIPGKCPFRCGAETGNGLKTKGPDVTKSLSEEAESVAHRSRRPCSCMRSMPFWDKHIEPSGGAARVFCLCAGLTSKYLMRPTFQVTGRPCRHF